MSDITDSLAKNELTKITKRILVTITLMDDLGNITKIPSKAVKEIISIKTDIRVKELTKDFDKQASKIKQKSDSIFGITEELDSANLSYDLDATDNIEKCILSNLFKVTYLDLIIDDSIDKNIELSEKIMKGIFSNFSCINIDVSKSFCIIKMPNLDISLESFRVTNGNIILNNDLSIIADSFIQIESCVINTTNKDKMFKFNLVSNNNSIYNVTVKRPVSINLLSAKPDNIDKYTTQSTSINSLRYIFDDINKDNNFTDALLSFRDIYSVKINGVSISGASNIKGIKVIKCYELMINNLSQVSSSREYTLGLSNVNKTYVSFMNVINDTDDGKSFAILIAEEGLKFNQTLSISDAQITGIGLIDVASAKADKLTITNSDINCINPIKTNDFNQVNKIRISDTRFTNSDINLLASNVSISNSTLVIRNGIKFISSSSNKIDNTKLYSNGDVNLSLELDSWANVSASEIHAKNINIYHDSENEETVENTKFVNETNRTLDISESVFIADEKIDIDDVFRLDSTSTTYKAKNIKISNIKNVSFDEDSLGLDSPFNFIAKNSIFKKSNFDIRKLIEPTKFCFDKSSGSCDIMFKELINGSVNYEFEYIDSKMNIELDTFGTKIACKLKSDNSLGSTLFGLNNTISVIPSMQSKDLNSFVNISNPLNKQSNKINYGNSDKSVSAIDSLLK